MGSGGVTSSERTLTEGSPPRPAGQTAPQAVPPNRYPSRSQRTQEPYEPPAEPTTLPKRSYDTSHLGRTLHAWRTELCAHFDHPTVSNGPTENLNLKIKNTKRIARGYRNFTHYRLQLLLNHGRIRQDRSPTQIRTRRPRFAA